MAKAYKRIKWPFPLKVLARFRTGTQYVF